MKNSLQSPFTQNPNLFGVFKGSLVDHPKAAFPKFCSNVHILSLNLPVVHNIHIRLRKVALKKCKKHFRMSAFAHRFHVVRVPR